MQYRNSNHPTNHFFLRLSHLADHTRDEYLKSLGAVPYVPPRFQQKHGHQNVLSAEDGTAALVEAMRSGAASGAAAEADAYTNQAFDWRSKNVLPPVGYQRVCGNCWAWAAKAQVEAAWAIAGYASSSAARFVLLSLISGLVCAVSNTLRTVSVQQITDCSDPNSCKGCNGGVFGIALLNLKEQGGTWSGAASAFVIHRLTAMFDFENTQVCVRIKTTRTRACRARATRSVLKWRRSKTSRYVIREGT